MNERLGSLNGVLHAARVPAANTVVRKEKQNG
jgi:hypothetical protein